MLENVGFPAVADIQKPIVISKSRLQSLDMIADPPPIPHCVQDVTQLQSQAIIVSGKAEAVTKWLSDPAVKDGPFKTSLSQMTSAED